MARVTVEDCLDNVENRFELVMVASKRARQLATGGKDPMVQEESDKPTVVALREIAEGFITPDILNREEELEAEEELAGVMDAGESFGEETGEQAPAMADAPEAAITPPINDEPL